MPGIKWRFARKTGIARAYYSFCLKGGNYFMTPALNLIAGLLLFRPVNEGRFKYHFLRRLKYFSLLR